MSEPLNPLMKVHGGGIQRDEASLTQILDSYLGQTVGGIPQRATTNWGAATGFPYPLIFTVSGTISATTDVAPWQIIPKNAIGMRVWAWCKTQPGTQEMLLDVMRSPLNAVTGYGSFVSIFSAGNKPGVASIGANGYSIPNLAVFNAGDAFRLDVTQVGVSPAGADLTVVLQCVIVDTNP
ncbi:MAG TPA: hypothetical protein VMR25_15725 [Planctomycetaceae bacterium]|nr:hypothetical protein [Planctomycetaceae bacterium]